jgi:hypothetical protein
MTMLLKGLVAVIGILMSVLGLRWVFAPESAAADLGITLGGAVGMNSARGDLGGLFIAGALFCFLGLARRDGRWLQAAALLLACVAVGRAIGIFVDGFASQSGVAIAIELVWLGVLLFTAARMASATRA